MPIYEYECSLCGHRLEVLQGISEPLLTDCPSCRRAGLRKLMSAAGFRLSGGGWYETDFKTGNKRNLTADGPSSGDAKSSGDGKSGDAKSSGGGKDAAGRQKKAAAAPDKPAGTQTSSGDG